MCNVCHHIKDLCAVLRTYRGARPEMSTHYTGPRKIADSGLCIGLRLTARHTSYSMGS